jgi:hypothetical protein
VDGCGELEDVMTEKLGPDVFFVTMEPGNFFWSA